MLAAVAALALLGACSSSDEMLEAARSTTSRAGKLPPLEVPPDLTAPARDDRYAVPETARRSATLSGYQAERGQAQPARQQRGAARRSRACASSAPATSAGWWCSEPPEKLWPLVQGILAGERLPAAPGTVPEAGVMETDWAENRAKIRDGLADAHARQGCSSRRTRTAERDKYRTRLERTPTGGTEIYISHRGMVRGLQRQRRAD